MLLIENADILLLQDSCNRPWEIMPACNVTRYMQVLVSGRLYSVLSMNSDAFF